MNTISSFHLLFKENLGLKQTSKTTQILNPTL